MTIPLWLKVIYTIFMLVLLPVYFHYYGPTNFLYFCDVALILTLVGIWREDALLISMCAVGIFAVQMVWVVDYVVMLFGGNLTGMTEYMFNSDTVWYLRALSLFHGWLPFLLVYLVYRIGYDPRGFLYWTVLAWALILICFFLLPGPRTDLGLTPVNVNYVWGIKNDAPQTWMPKYVWLVGMIVLLPAVAYYPVHLALKKLFG